MTRAIRPPEGISERSTLIAAEIESVRAMEETGFKEINLEAKIRSRGRAMVEAVYFRSLNPTDETPIGINPGLGATQDVYIGLAKNIANHGRDSYVINAPRDQDFEAWFSLKHQLNPSIHQQQATGAMMREIHFNPEIIAAKNGEPVTEFDLAGHSKGNHDAVAAALHINTVKQKGPVRVRSLTSLAGAGLDGEGGIPQLWNHFTSLPKIGKREVWDGIPKMLKANGKDMMKSELIHIANLERFLRETGHIILKPQVGPMVIELRGMGMPYAALIPRKDEIFDEDDVMETSGDIIDFAHYMEDANHVVFNTRPESAVEVVAISNVMNRPYYDQEAA